MRGIKYTQKIFLYQYRKDLKQTYFDTMLYENIESNSNLSSSLSLSDYLTNLSKDDILFIASFIGKNKILTEKEVGKKLGISQQAIHKRKKKIRNKKTSGC